MYSKRRFINGLGVLLVIFFNSALAASDTGVKLVTKEVDFFDSTTHRPAKIKFWYQQGAPSCNAQICLASTQNKSRVAVISHGAFGSPHAMNWLGYALASQGWVVLGVAHFGESWVYGQGTIDPSTPMRFWQRPQEVHFALDSLSDESLFNVPLVTNRVVMLGHSSGGFTALAMAGARLEAGKSEHYCQSARSKGDLSCQYGSKSKVLTDEQKQKISVFQNEMQDQRIVAVVALDPAMGHATSEDSLSKVKIPTLIIGSVENDFLPFNVHANYYAEHIPNAQLIGLEQGAGHFVYIDSCDGDRKARGVSLCVDRKGVDRKRLQQKMLKYIFEFIYSQGL
jgi:predicted dienelactone hydrolase